MSQDSFIYITSDLRPYLSVIEFGLESLERQMNSPFFELPPKPIGEKPHFARVILSDKAYALLQKIQRPGQKTQDILYAALMLAKSERIATSSYYRSS